MNEIDKAAHDIAMLYINLNFNHAQPSVEKLAHAYCKARIKATEIIAESAMNSIGNAPEWPE
ncbi:hypothetical protein AB6A23_11220 [Paenibacillus tarimensis]